MFTAVFLIFLYIIFGIVWLVAWAQIFSKAGYSGWLSLLFLVPIVNIILFLWFAFSTWPVGTRASRG
jgi:hypothetical protein